MTSSTVTCPACKQELPVTPTADPLGIPEAATLIQHAESSACGAPPEAGSFMADLAAALAGDGDGPIPVVLRTPNGATSNDHR